MGVDGQLGFAKEAQKLEAEAIIPGGSRSDSRSTASPVSISPVSGSGSLTPQDDIQAMIDRFNANGWTKEHNVHALELLQAAKALELDTLMEACTDFLVHMLARSEDKNTCAVALIVRAHLAGAKRLQEHCMAIIVDDLVESSTGKGESSSSDESMSDDEGDGYDEEMLSDEGESRGEGSGSGAGGNNSDTSEESNQSQQRLPQPSPQWGPMFTGLCAHCPDLMQQITERVALKTARAEAAEA